MTSKVITPPIATAVPIDLAKMNCRVDFDAEDPLFMHFLRSIEQDCEKIQGLSYITQTRELITAAALSFEISYPPLQSVTSVTVNMADGSDVLLGDDDYSVDETKAVPVMKLNSLPAGASTVTVVYVAGFGDTADAVPGNIKDAILLRVSARYADRENGESEVGLNMLYRDRINW